MRKLPGKTEYSGRRRTTTRSSGFKSHPDSTGGEYRQGACECYALPANSSVVVRFEFPVDIVDHYTAFGIYFRIDGNITVSVDNPNTQQGVLEQNPFPNWSKAGSIWKSSSGQKDVTISFVAQADSTLELYEPSCGIVWHDEFFSGARDAVMRNLYYFAPEANFYEQQGTIERTSDIDPTTEPSRIPLKTCNRCARYLPINVDDERRTLSFSNHCIARAPCKHGGFGRLKNQDTGRMVQLHFGYQLECRFCKKFAVNAALNPQRTAAQMKEDGQRRRHFELLITELYRMSPQLAYRHKTGRELTDDIWRKFKGHCFKCNRPLRSVRYMHLDHTRPLALLWQLDETATALCPGCNSAKRDRPPIEFYNLEELQKLSAITGVPLKQLSDPSPNEEVLAALIEKSDWLMKEFLMRPDIQKDRDGKVTAELICKALDKVIDRSSLSGKFSFLQKYRRHFH